MYLFHHIMRILFMVIGMGILIPAATAGDTITGWAGIDLATNANGIATQHGIALVAWERNELPHDARIHLELNTDTLIVDYGHHRLSDTVTFGARIRGEIHFGNLLPDFYVGGERIDAYGVSASFLEVALRTKWNPAKHHFLTGQLGFQPWFLRRSRGLAGDGTDKRLVIPDPVLLFRPRLDYTFWNPGDDPSNWEQHRPFPRVNGISTGVSVGLDMRNQEEAWGYLQGPDSDPVLQRNDPETVAWFTRAWYLWGVLPHEHIRMQGSGRFGYGRGGDDITRSLLGGQNQYVVRIPGLPWGGLTSERYAQSDLELRGRINNKHELGVGGSIAAVPDPLRVGDFDHWAPIPSVYLLADIRFDGWQLDIRGAWASEPSEWTVGPHFGVFVSMGKTWTIGNK